MSDNPSLPKPLQQFVGKIHWQDTSTPPKKSGEYVIYGYRYGVALFRMARFKAGDKSWKFPSAAQGVDFHIHYWGTAEPPDHVK